MSNTSFISYAEFVKSLAKKSENGEQQVFSKEKKFNVEFTKDLIQGEKVLVKKGTELSNVSELSLAWYKQNKVVKVL